MPRGQILSDLRFQYEPLRCPYVDRLSDEVIETVASSRAETCLLTSTALIASFNVKPRAIMSSSIVISSVLFQLLRTIELTASAPSAASTKSCVTSEKSSPPGNSIWLDIACSNIRSSVISRCLYYRAKADKISAKGFLFRDMGVREQGAQMRTKNLGARVPSASLLRQPRRPR